VLNLSAPASLPALKAGEQGVFHLTLSNLGNDDDTVHLEAQMPPGWTVSIPNQAAVRQGESHLIAVTVQAPAAALPAEQAALQVTARSVGCPAVTSRLERVLMVEGSRLFLPLVSR
jgi:uncharacterized membrane protein